MKTLKESDVQITSVMKRLSVKGALIAAAGLTILLAGCVERRVVYVPPPATTGEVMVNQAPPAPPQEVIVAAPGPGYAWVPGYYAWHGHWVWVRGSWVVRPHPHSVYVPGHWSQRGHGYVWIGGYWR
jgi:hypothetical protein